MPYKETAVTAYVPWGYKRLADSLVGAEENITPLLRLANRHYILEKGRTVWSGSSAELAAASELQHRYLGV